MSAGLSWSQVAPQVGVFINAFRPWIALCVAFGLASFGVYLFGVVRGRAHGAGGARAGVSPVAGAGSTAVAVARSAQRRGASASAARNKVPVGKGEPGLSKAAAGPDPSTEDRRKAYMRRMYGEKS